ncbi:MAG: hypothetical protein COZ06_13510 [Armatimonadetes bacterium CG_4_10_14_3_um_filter_66_18]|nr:type II toxin-antitoxin system VapC family toxin [Armatimonadota bacterium]OIP05608.1 MAG: hypothetical protein AUJ96_10500 [Armatimonadetes bacterium CG2_30_66_41]PIU95674.1 MAG: hypothetical protein COS65_01225 [Armatimonadetes bacterium CG06_land_8_20_14_3_00_66_21]PIW15114.1 MAG: hypothetical protein COW34_07035 [Armatimonadetes bacterium CG17_big_fil_post_rev_8_21_14_2_50_66_6]PIX37054.1 MAG: hypothetical protein COZ57_36320 [Armatimonadetes bacterium CG_4_8_14_3_um_filter_66_20]PIY496
MVGVDTNVLVRYIAEDDPAQLRLVDSLIDSVDERHEKLFVNLVSLCELVWVLDSCYGFTKADILGALERILETQQLDVQSRSMVRLAIADYRAAGADFADCLRGRVNTAHGCATTYTLDKRASRLNGYALLA